MLLTEIYSDKDGHLTGQLEMGGRVTLHCPNPRVFVGKRNFSNPSEDLDNLAKGLFNGDLVSQAREDRDHYYFIGETQRTESGIFVIPYLMF